MIGFILGLLISTNLPAQQNAGVVLTRDQIDGIVQPMIDEGNAQSIVVGIIDSTGTHVYGYGKISKDIDRAPDGKTVYEIGSVTKTFTATILALMKEDGLVNLEDPIQKYLPAGVQIAVKDRPITLLDIATQHSGLPRMPDNLSSKNPKDPYADYDESKLFAFLKSWKPTRAPGAEYEYSNLAVGMLGHLLARHVGVTYEKLLHDSVTGPLQMSDTSIALNDSQKARLAPGHDNEGNVVPNWNLNEAIAGAGGIRSTCDDMIKYVQAEMNPPDGKLGDAIRETHEAREDVSPGRQIGLIWMLDAGGICIWHNGETGGYHSFVAFGPDAGVGVVMLTNSANAGIDLAGSDIIRQQLGMPALPKPEPRQAIDLTNQQLDRFVGDYQLGPMKLSIWRNDDKLMAQLTDQPAFRIYPDSEKSVFWKVVDAQLDFDFADDKSPAKSVTLHQNGQNIPAPRIAPATKPATKPSK